MTLILLCGQLVPFILVPAPVISLVQLLAALACLFVFHPRCMARRRFRQTWLGVILHPLAIVALLGIQWLGLVRFLRGLPAVWKGRAYSPSAREVSE